MEISLVESWTVVRGCLYRLIVPGQQWRMSAISETVFSGPATKSYLPIVICVAFWHAVIYVRGTQITGCKGVFYLLFDEINL